MVKQIESDKLITKIYTTREEMGENAALAAADKIIQLQKEKSFVNIVFAAAPSQIEMLKNLILQRGIDWNRIRAFHMDEYLGLPRDSENSFAQFLNRAIFSKVKPKEVFYIGNGDSADEICSRYTSLIEKYPPDLVLLGIGENTHIAFNDPPTADFKDERLVKVVELDSKCRRQQVNDKTFMDFDSVPKFAVTMTIPALVKAKHLICTVPAKAKAWAVWQTMYGEICERYPSTAMRLHDSAVMYTDIDSARNLLLRTAVITDEISQDFEKACELAEEFCLSGVELRSVWDTSPENLTGNQINEIKMICKKYNKKVVAISSSIFKCDWGNDENLKIEKTIELAKALNCKFIRAFSFWKSDRYSDKEFIKILEALEKRVSAENLTLLLESDPSVNLSSGKELARVLKAAGLENVRAIWDACNDIYSCVDEDPYPNGYNAIKPYIGHIHLKDAVIYKDGSVRGAPFGCGVMDWRGQIKALIVDGYSGYFVMETHFKKNNIISDKLLKNPMGSAFSDGGEEATRECLANLQEMIAVVYSEIYCR